MLRHAVTRIAIYKVKMTRLAHAIDPAVKLTGDPSVKLSDVTASLRYK